MPLDPIAVIEAAYHVDLPVTAWLELVGDAIYGQVGMGLGILAFEYRVDGEYRVHVGNRWERDLPASLGDTICHRVEDLPAWFVRSTYARCDADTASHAGGDSRVQAESRVRMQTVTEAVGRRDRFIVSGIDPTHHGVYFGTWLSDETQLDPDVRETWARIAIHLATAHRLRRRLSEAERRSPETADAVLTPSGRIDRARDGADEDEARRELRDAVLGMERARAGARGDVEPWRGLVSGRWSLVDQFELSGKRYVLARRNDIRIDGLAALTERERQAISYAALGHTNKLIAYEMGIAASTVGVLLHRASQKVGARSREELIARYRELAFTSEL